jgi:hypothetical protein
MRTRLVAERYLELASAGDADAIADLYAEDAVFLPNPPHEVIVRGRDAIRQHYLEHVTAVKPEFRSLRWIVNGGDCCLEFVAYLPARDALLFSVDVFTVNPDGKIARMAAYRRATGD